MVALFRSEFRVYAVRAEPEGDRLKAELRTGATPNRRNPERAWKGLPWWKRGFTPEPQPPAGI